MSSSFPLAMPSRRLLSSSSLFECFVSPHVRRVSQVKERQDDTLRILKILGDIQRLLELGRRAVNVILKRCPCAEDDKCPGGPHKFPCWRNKAWLSSTSVSPARGSPAKLRCVLG